MTRNIDLYQRLRKNNLKVESIKTLKEFVSATKVPFKKESRETILKIIEQQYKSQEAKEDIPDHL